MRFPATVEPAGNATGIEVPAEIVTALGVGKRPKVAITFNGHTWRSGVASRGGRFIVGISAANRAACGIAEGDRVEAEVTRPRMMRFHTGGLARWLNEFRWRGRSRL